MAHKIMDVESIRGDEYYTLEKDVEIIAQHLIRPLKVWCPFDSEFSKFPPVLERHGHKVIATSYDFFKTDPPAGTEAIISNPPFSRKKEVLERIKQLGIPFVLILPYLWMNDGVPFDYGHQIMMFRKRMFFEVPSENLGGGTTLNKPRTNCFVLSNGLLQHDFTVIR